MVVGTTPAGDGKLWLLDGPLSTLSGKLGLSRTARDTRTERPSQPFLQNSSSDSQSQSRSQLVPISNERTVNLFGGSSSLDVTMAHEGSSTCIEDVGLQCMFSTQLPGNVLHFLPATTVGNLEFKLASLM